MKIFDWVKDIEDIYEKLIEKAKMDNKNNLDDFKKQQEHAIKEFHDKNEEFIHSTLNIISEDTIKGIKMFGDQLNIALEAIKNEFQKEKYKLIEKIIEEFGFNFK